MNIQNRYISLLISIFAFTLSCTSCNRNSIPCPKVEDGAKEKTVAVEGNASITAYEAKKKNQGTLNKKQDKRLRNKRTPIKKNKNQVG